jgi:hypothetical protein
MGFMDALNDSQTNMTDWAMTPQPYSGAGSLVDTSSFGFSDSFLNELVPTNTSGGTGFDSDFWFGNSKTGTGGAAMPIINGLTGAAQAYLGFEGLGLAKDQFARSKHEFDLNFGMQKEAFDRSVAAANADAAFARGTA